MIEKRYDTNYIYIYIVNNFWKKNILYMVMSQHYLFSIINIFYYIKAVFIIILFRRL